MKKKELGTQEKINKIGKKNCVCNGLKLNTKKKIEYTEKTKKLNN